jgi:hypothetical protein
MLHFLPIHANGSDQETGLYQPGEHVDQLLRDVDSPHAADAVLGRDGARLHEAHVPVAP